MRTCPPNGTRLSGLRARTRLPGGARGIGAVVAVLTVTLFGCADGSATDPPAESRPTGSRQLLLRMTSVTGMLPPGGQASYLPAFSLYGDGTAIVSESATGTLPSGARALTLSKATVDSLLAAAREALDGPDERGDPTPDGSVTTFTVFAGGHYRVVKVFGVDASTKALRDRLLRYAEEQGSPYKPGSVAVLATSGGGGEPAPWPLGDLRSGASLQGSFCSVLRGRDAERALQLAADASPASVWSSHGVAYHVAVRPLLPDEHDCADLP